MTQPSALRDARESAAPSRISSPTSRSSAPACSAPPPPNGMIAKRPGSWPRSIETSRIAPAIRALATSTIASAASVASRPSGFPTCVKIARLRRLDVEPLELAADRAARR